MARRSDHDDTDRLRALAVDFADTYGLDSFQRAKLVELMESIPALEVDRMRKALAFIADDRKLTVDHLRGYADGVLQGLAAEAEGRKAGR